MGMKSRKGIQIWHFDRFSCGFTSNECLIFHILHVQPHQKYINVCSDFSYNHPLPHTLRIYLGEIRSYNCLNTCEVREHTALTLSPWSTATHSAWVHVMSTALPNNEKRTQKNISYQIKEYIFHLKKTIINPALL